LEPHHKTMEKKERTRRNPKKLLGNGAICLSCGNRDSKGTTGCVLGKGKRKTSKKNKIEKARQRQKTRERGKEMCSESKRTKGEKKNRRGKKTSGGTGSTPPMQKNGPLYGTLRPGGEECASTPPRQPIKRLKKVGKNSGGKLGGPQKGQANYNNVDKRGTLQKSPWRGIMLQLKPPQTNKTPTSPQRKHKKNTKRGKKERKISYIKRPHGGNANGNKKKGVETKSTPKGMNRIEMENKVLKTVSPKKHFMPPFSEKKGLTEENAGQKFARQLMKKFTSRTKKYNTPLTRGSL